HVWLNAGSSITYPASFGGNTREVEMTGEAYFEIAKDASKPFIVKKGETSVTVLGTHFNVNAYDDEKDLRVTLLEGSVNVNGTKIRPNQQAIVGDDIRVTDKINIEEVMAWKNGLFRFETLNIEQIMRQVSRWYDVEIVYESHPQEHFKGDIPRDVPVSKVLQLLEATEAVHFKIENKRIIVMK
ncbi:MAG TPA: FecR domain-containing protein, partial [Chitinophagaceae bacterium]|nr:FecR domain-containing protein [Chitinophagaceae bacterium]